jgi:hypothetical protein
MGTYMYCQLKNTEESHIKECNKEVEKLGFKPINYEGISYGPFLTTEALEQDARFLNEDPEGLKQVTHFKRPISIEFLQTFFWNKIGLYCIKLSGGSPKENLLQALIVAKWAAKNKHLIDQEKSSHHTPQIVRSYIYM